jgi:glycosyltransferase involved in cell wall biosynthesis
MSHYDLFFLPTAGENYGHVILEAALAGLPLLISNNTPWRNLKKEGVGWDINLENKRHFIKAINEVFAMNQDQHFAWRNRIQQWGKQKQKNQEDIEQNKTLFYHSFTRKKIK